MLRRANKKQSDHITIGLDPQGDGVAVAVARRAGASVRLQCDFLPYSGGTALSPVLAPYCEKNHLTKQPAVLVLPAAHYSLLQSSMPVMDRDEMRVAAKWKIGELIDFPVETAVVDAFELPEAAQRGAERLLYVVASKRNHIQQHVDDLRQAGLLPQAIDIGELSLRNVIARMPENDQGAVVLLLAERSGLLAVVKKSEVYLARRLDIGYDDLALGEQRLFDEVVLELQRSMDYFERHFMQALPARLLMFPPDKLSGELILYLNSHLKLDAEPLLLEKLPGCVIAADEESQGRCLLAVGAALREERAA